MQEKTGTKEWAERTCNVQVGCEHDCKYCYAKSMAIRFGLATADGWKFAEPSGMKPVPWRRKHEVTMFPSTHDVTELNSAVCGGQVIKLLESGDDVLLVTKAKLGPLHNVLGRFVNTPFKGRIEVRVTIGTCVDRILKFWEPGAPTFAERLEALEWAHEAGFRTSVSAEPVLDPCPMVMIAQVLHAVSGDVWIGRARQLVQRVAMNCPGDAVALDAAKRLEELWDDARVLRLYDRLKAEPWVKWKDSMMEVIEKQGSGFGVREEEYKGE